MNKKTVWIVIAWMLVVAALVSGCTPLHPDTTEKPEQNTTQNPQQNSEQTAEQNPVQNTEDNTEQNTEQAPEQPKTFSVMIVHKDGTKKELTLDIKEEYLGAALIGAGVVEAEENRFGMHITKADGERAVFEEDSAYWAVYVGEDFATKSTDLTPVEGGKTYKLVYTEPVLEDAEEPSWYLLKHVFMPIARGQVGTDWDTVSAFFNKHGYKSGIDEGTYGIRDPYRGWSNIGGDVTNANGYREIASLYYILYDGNNIKASAGVICRNDANENPSYKINVRYNNNKKEVDSLKEVEECIRNNG